jgi:translation initiation factor 2D
MLDLTYLDGSSLWEMGNEVDLPSIPYPRPRVPLIQSSNPAHQPTTSESQNGEAPGTSATGTSELEHSTSNLSLKDGAQNTGSLSVSEIDAYLSAALYQALATIGSSGTPISASSLYSGHVLPSRPASIPAHLRDDVVIGKSSWKKLAKWMKLIEKEGLIKAKEGRGGEITITTIHAEHPSIALRRAHKTIAKEEEQLKRAAAAPDQNSAVAAQTPSGNGKGRPKEMSIEEMWKPNGANIAFWETCGIE